MIVAPTIDAVMAALADIADPCMLAAGLDLSLVDLGLIYDVDIAPGRITVALTMTEAGCPFTHRVMEQSYIVLESLAPGMTIVVVPQWEPIWTEARMNDKAHAALSASRLRMVKRMVGGARATA